MPGGSIESSCMLRVWSEEDVPWLCVDLFIGIEDTGRDFYIGVM